MILYKEYITKDNQEYKISVWFRKNSEYSSGYVVTVIPVKRTSKELYSLEEYGCFTGFNKLLLEKQRKHPIYFKQALSILNQEKESLVEYCSNLKSEYEKYRKL